MTFSTLTSAIGSSDVIAARVWLPAWGVGSALVKLARGDLMAGPMVLTLGALVISCTYQRGAPFVGKGEYRVLFGGGGWSTEIPAQSYRNPQTALSTLAQEAAALVGERIVMDVDGERVVGRYNRTTGPASRVLNIYAPQRWWVEIDGSTHVGDRTPLPTPSVRVLDYDPALGVVTISEDDAFVMPGQSFESGGVTGLVSTVIHTIEGGALRTEVYLQ